MKTEYADRIPANAHGPLHLRRGDEIFIGPL